MEQEWIPKEGEMVRVSKYPLSEKNRGVVVEFNYFHYDGIIDSRGNEWNYIERYEKEQTWRDVLNAEAKDLDYIPEEEQQQIKQKLMPELKKRFEPIPGKTYEFYDYDGRFPENLIFVGKCGDLYLGCYEDVYELLLKKYPASIIAWKGISEVKEKKTIKITVDQILEKFNISKDDKVELEGLNYNFSVDEQQKLLIQNVENIIKGNM